MMLFTHYLASLQVFFILVFDMSDLIKRNETQPKKETTSTTFFYCSHCLNRLALEYFRSQTRVFRSVLSHFIYLSMMIPLNFSPANFVLDETV